MPRGLQGETVMRIISRALAVLAAISVVGAGSAQAQEKKVGITIAYPSAVGVIWHATDRVALRPEITFSRSTSELNASFGGTEGTGWGVSTGISALFYVQRWDDVRGYLSPRIAYGRTSSRSSSLLSTIDSETTITTWSWSASYGVQYRPSDPFSIYGEVGIGGSSGETKGSTAPSLRSSSTSWGTRAGIGMALYF